jgi:hypothetical protein
VTLTELSDGVCVRREFGVRRSVSCWCVWQETGFSRSEKLSPGPGFRWYVCVTLLSGMSQIMLAYWAHINPVHGPLEIDLYIYSSVFRNLCHSEIFGLGGLRHCFVISDVFNYKYFLHCWRRNVQTYFSPRLCVAEKIMKPQTDPCSHIPARVKIPHSWRSESSLSSFKHCVNLFICVPSITHAQQIYKSHLHRVI